MKSCRRLVIGTTLASLLLGAVPIGTTWAHYANTPTFREWARSHPADDEVWRARVPDGVVLASETPWRSLEGPAGERRGQWRPQVTITHGDETLLDLELDISIESREVDGWEELGVPSEAFEALNVTVLSSTLDPDFHAVAMLTVVGLSHYAGSPAEAERPQGPNLELDVFVLSGPGELEVFAQDHEREAAAHGHSLLGGREFASPGLWQLTLLSEVVFAGDPPDEGLAYQARSTFYPNWTSTPGGGSSAGVGQWRFAATTRSYSAKLSSAEAMRSPFDPLDHFSFSRTAEVHRFYTWNGRVW